MAYVSPGPRRARQGRHHPAPVDLLWFAGVVGLFGTIVGVLVLAGTPAKEAIVGGCCAVFVGCAFALYHGYWRVLMAVAMAVAAVIAAVAITHKSVKPHVESSVEPKHYMAKTWIVGHVIHLGPHLRWPVSIDGELEAITGAGPISLAGPGVEVPTVYRTKAKATALAAGDGKVVAVMNDHLVARDAVRGDHIQTAPTATGPGPVQIGGGFVWAADQAASKVFRFSLSNLRRPYRISVPSAVNGFAYAGSRVWVSTKATPLFPGYLGRLHLRTDVDRKQLPEGGRLLGYFDKTFWISVGLPGHAMQLLRWNLGERQVKRPIRLSASVLGLVYLGGMVFVLEHNGQLLAVNPSSDRQVDRLTLRQHHLSGITTLRSELEIASASGTLTPVQYHRHMRHQQRRRASLRQHLLGGAE